MECPICGTIARAIRAPSFYGRKINCPQCGSFDISRVVLENHTLHRMERGRRLEILERARRAAPAGTRPMITTYLL
jgi:hypothetical protein